MSEYCTVYGHEYYRLPCRGCRAEALAASTAGITSSPAAGAPEPDPAVRAALHNHRTPDARERAAGTTRDED